ncbi:MAG: hypothetical protein J1G38_05745 [Clostridiales bacterium]|nr:hypothetical protein [Clostridiales bacterium]
MAILGFARRAGKVRYGLDELKKAKSVKLYAVCVSASDNLVSDMKALSSKTHKPLVIAKRDSFTEGNCKAIGITDSNMASGMTEYAKDNEEYEFYRFTEDR